MKLAPVIACPTSVAVNTRTRGRVVPLFAHLALWAIAGAIFLWLAALHVDFGGQFGPILPFHSTNNYLARLIGSQTGSEDLLVVFDGLPENEPVAVVYRDDEERDTFLALMVTYLAWPRKIEFFPIKRETAAKQIDALKRTHVTATFFCGLDAPPQIGPVFHIGNGIIVVPRTAAPR
jgi:hypothetical protein